MGCNCKTTKKILDIQQKYGTPVNVSTIEKIKYYIEEIPKLVLIAMLFVILSPFLIIVYIVMIIKENGTINVNKLLKQFIKRK